MPFRKSEDYMYPATQISISMFFTAVGDIKLYKYVCLVKKEKLRILGKKNQNETPAKKRLKQSKKIKN